MSVPLDWHGDKSADGCVKFYQVLDLKIESAGVQDVQSSRIAGFPFLRTNRFLASFKDETMDADRLSDWVKRMQLLASQAYAIEWKNLPQHARNITIYRSSVSDELAYCSALLTDHLLRDVDKQRALQERIFVADDYQAWKRALGLYPITAWAFMLGINNWHEETREVFAMPVTKLPVLGKLHRYVPKEDVVMKDVAFSSDALGVPDLSASEKESLFKRFAPIVDVDVVTQDDEIGRMIRDPNMMIDSDDPVVYEHLSYTRFDGQVLLQLNYIFWFSARPKTSAIDMLGGNLDGIIWRVTLDKDGQPLAYDTVHHCGCYHMFFPTQRLVVESEGAFFEESALIPQFAPSLSADERMILRVEHGSHYIQRVSKTNSNVGDRDYRTKDYQSLRSLPSGGEHQSAFDDEGLIPDTERLERYVFWPMGIAEPGAMRQWGHHATAFVGRRHFDDANLLGRYFKRKK